MYYCEKCHVLNEQIYCKHCGKNNLRSPDERDYCFLTEVDFMFGEMFKGILENEKIPYVDYPSGNGVRSFFALKLENLKIFVTYEFFNKAKTILNEIANNFEDEQNKNLKENINMLFIQSRTEKKIKKNLKMTEKDSIVDYCYDKILNADKIINEGKISSCVKGGNYLFIYKDNIQIVINSVTYEIISIKEYLNLDTKFESGGKNANN